MTNERNNDGFQPFFIFSSPWEQVAVFFFFFPLLLFSVALLLQSLFPLYHGSKLIWGVGGWGEFVHASKCNFLSVFKVGVKCWFNSLPHLYIIVFAHKQLQGCSRFLVLISTMVLYPVRRASDVFVSNYKFCDASCILLTVFKLWQ